jgi:hypothetical protein
MVSASSSCCWLSRENVSTMVGSTIPYRPSMSHDAGQRSVQPAYTFDHTPGHAQAEATAPFSNCQPSTWRDAVAAAVEARATPTSMPAAFAGAVAVTVNVVHPAVVDPVRVLLVP